MTRFADMTWPERALLLCGVLMFVVCCCGVLTADVLPVKPRDGTLALLGLCALPLLLSRKQYCVPALLLMTLPLLRVADAALLQRFDIRELGDQKAAVMNMLPPVLVTFTTLIILSSRVGRRFAVWSATTLILVIVASNLYEWLGYAHWSSIQNRVAGFHRHPNTGPTYALLCLGVLYALSPRFWTNLGLTLLAGIPTMLSISRSCTVIYFGVAGLYVLLNARRHARGLIIVALALPPVFSAWLATVQASATHGRIRPDEFTEGRLAAIYKFDVQGLKSQERGKDLADGWRAVWKSPVWGYGTGCAAGERWQPHNQIVALWLELGIGGVLIYLAQLLFALVLSARMGLRAGWCLLPLFLDIPCLHWLTDMPPYWFALAVAYHELVQHRIAFQVRDEAPEPPVWHLQSAH
jgi:hypothetical protein